MLASTDGGGVAWWAHIGGFVAGMLLLRFFRDDSRRSCCYRSKT
jgi:membrane associated rhomboid family serine protease